MTSKKIHSITQRYTNGQLQVFKVCPHFAAGSKPGIKLSGTFDFATNATGELVFNRYIDKVGNHF